MGKYTGHREIQVKNRLFTVYNGDEEGPGTFAALQRYILHGKVVGDIKPVRRIRNSYISEKTKDADLIADIVNTFSTSIIWE